LAGIKMTKEEFKKLIMLNFERIDGRENINVCDGAQLINGEWYMPIWGCDTIQNILDGIGE
jgi:hypothetical protein